MKKFLLAAAVLSLSAACGKTGNLEYPPDALYPRRYPAPHFPKRTALTAAEQKPSEASEQKAEKKELAPDTKENEK